MHTEFQVGPRVIADGQQWLTRDLRGGIGKAVTEVEAGRVTAAAETLIGTVRCVGVFGGEVDDGQVDLAAKAIKHRSGYRSLAGGEDYQGFGQRGGTDGG